MAAAATTGEDAALVSTAGAPSPAYSISFEDVTAARARIKDFVHRTPVMTSSTVDRLAERAVFFKCELFQRSGSFKARGAFNAVMKLSAEDAARGVVTHSSGNHAQAIAIAAGVRGVPAHIVMPRSTPAVKKAATAGYGAHIIECESTTRARVETAERIQRETGAHFVHPSNDPDVMAGQGTLALELFEQVAELRGVPASTDSDEPVLDAVIVPIGGGGMISGVATAIKGLDPRIRVFAAEPAAADDAFRSKAAGHIVDHESTPVTVADGLKTTLGDHNWPIIRDKVEAVLRVPEDDIKRYTRFVWEYLKLVRVHDCPPRCGIEKRKRRGKGRGKGWSIACPRQHHRRFSFLPFVVNSTSSPPPLPPSTLSSQWWLHRAQCIEPSAAVGVGAVLGEEFRRIPGIRRVGIVLCGGNVDLDALPWAS